MLLPEVCDMKKTTNKTPGFTRYEKIIIILLALLQFTIILDFMIISPLGSFMIRSLDMSTSMFGYIVSSYGISAGISGILTATFADKFDRKKLLVFFYTGFILGNILCILSSSYTMLLFARVVTGLFGGAINAILMAIVGDMFALEQRGRVMGAIQMAFSVSQVIGIPLGLYFAAHWGWQSAFSIIVAIAILVLMAIIFKMKPIDQHLVLKKDKKSWTHLGHTLLNKNYQIGFLLTGLVSLGAFMFMPFISTFLVNNVLINQGQLSLIFLSTGIVTSIALPVIGKLSDQLDKFKLFSIGSFIAILMMIIYTNLPPVTLWCVILVNVLLFVAIMSRNIPAATLDTAIPRQQDRGAYMGISASLKQLAGGIGAALSGLIVSQNDSSEPLLHFDTLGYIVAGSMLFCVYLEHRICIFVKKKNKGNE